MELSKELSKEFHVPGYSELDESTYRQLVQKISHQRDLIRIQQLQLQKPGFEDPQQIFEKDRLILNLEKRVDELTKSEKLSHELEEELEEKEKLLISKNKQIRDMETRYNDHLNRLTVELQASQKELEITKKNLETTRIDFQNLQIEFQNLNQEIESKQVSLSSEGPEHTPLSCSLESHDRIVELERQLEISGQKLAYTQNLLEQAKQDLIPYNDEEILKEEILSLREEIKVLKQKTTTTIPLPLQEDVSYNTLCELWQTALKLCEKDSPLLLKIASFCKSKNLQIYHALGQVFDPQKHECEKIFYSFDHENDVVFEERSPGFLVNGAIVQKSKVYICKNPFHCQNCKRTVGNDGIFCPHCGNRLLNHENSESLKIDDEANANAYARISEVLFLERNYKKAMENLKKAIVINPQNQDFLLKKIRFEEVLGNIEQARSDLISLMQTGFDPKICQEILNRLDTKAKILSMLYEI